MDVNVDLDEDVTVMQSPTNFYDACTVLQQVPLDPSGHLVRSGLPKHALTDL